ncbi:MAG: D-aminoacyl-tRNA deacylase [Crocinitomicaceae bacterium]|nr:D-aminoacyl-tRNA deacylase [Crocinitomicaceae bacterium]MDG1735653.1 D-aminoacyl-tRNA deacylase [Crocinitomicaceae bacterium]MDG2505962.1 D-aminoacyl-tRNA deacylase [Crocinitomicaceae bacterium]
MRIIIQRVTQASVTIDKRKHAQINKGFLVLIGIEEKDTELDADYLVQKTIGLRVFNDSDCKMNLNLNDVQGEVLIISQFTLHAKTRKGNRPSFITAAKPEYAVPLYNYFSKQLNKQLDSEVRNGVFGADMKVTLLNDGPVTIIIDSKNKE